MKRAEEKKKEGGLAREDRERKNKNKIIITVNQNKKKEKKRKLRERVGYQYSTIRPRSLDHFYRTNGQMRNKKM